MGFCTFLEVPRRIVHISEFLMGLCTFRKFLMGFCALFEVNHGILCIFGSSSWEFVHIWKFLVGFCAFLEFPHGKAYKCPFHPFTFSLQNTCFHNMHTD